MGSTELGWIDFISGSPTSEARQGDFSHRGLAKCARGNLLQCRLH